MRLTQAVSQDQYEAVQQENLCFFCSRIWNDCSSVVRRTKVIAFRPRSVGYIVTVKCDSFSYWPERGQLLNQRPFIFGDRIYADRSTAG